jgi:hypothetical protein
VLDANIPDGLHKTAQLDPFWDLIIVEVNREMVGYRRISNFDESDEERVYALRGSVVPAWQRKGIRRAFYPVETTFGLMYNAAVLITKSGGISTP